MFKTMFLHKFFKGLVMLNHLDSLCLTTQYTTYSTSLTGTRTFRLDTPIQSCSYQHNLDHHGFPFYKHLAISKKKTINSQLSLLNYFDICPSRIKNMAKPREASGNTGKTPPPPTELGVMPSSDAFRRPGLYCQAQNTLNRWIDIVTKFVAKNLICWFLLMSDTIPVSIKCRVSKAPPLPVRLFSNIRSFVFCLHCTDKSHRRQCIPSSDKVVYNQPGDIVIKNKSQLSKNPCSNMPRAP